MLASITILLYFGTAFAIPVEKNSNDIGHCFEICRATWDQYDMNCDSESDKKDECFSYNNQCQFEYECRSHCFLVYGGDYYPSSEYLKKCVDYENDDKHSWKQNNESPKHDWDEKSSHVVKPAGKILHEEKDTWDHYNSWEPRYEHLKANLNPSKYGLWDSNRKYGKVVKESSEYNHDNENGYSDNKEDNKYWRKESWEPNGESLKNIKNTDETTLGARSYNSDKSDYHNEAKDNDYYEPHDDKKYDDGKYYGMRSLNGRNRDDSYQNEKEYNKPDNSYNSKKNYGVSSWNDHDYHDDKDYYENDDNYKSKKHYG
ncbi:hypothetical protein HK096_001002, partial [Nowakowskiella sp. JEL0078]